MSVHPTAAAGFSDATAYERARPAFGAGVIEALQISSTDRVADVGAGTGKLTAQLPGRVIAVEPVAGMRTRFQADAVLVAGTAEAMPFADATFDAICVAQAFHWFDGPVALASLRRVLKPDGALHVIFNVRDESLPWMRDIAALLNAHRADTPSHASGRWREAFEASSDMTPLELTEVDNPQPADATILRERLRSISFVALLPADEQATLLDRCAAIFTAANADHIPQRCRVFTSRRIR